MDQQPRKHGAYAGGEWFQRRKKRAFPELQQPGQQGWDQHDLGAGEAPGRDERQHGKTDQPLFFSHFPAHNAERKKQGGNGKNIRCDSRQAIKQRHGGKKEQQRSGKEGTHPQVEIFCGGERTEKTDRKEKKQLPGEGQPVGQIKKNVEQQTLIGKTFLQKFQPDRRKLPGKNRPEPLFRKGGVEQRSRACDPVAAGKNDHGSEYRKRDSGNGKTGPCLFPAVAARCTHPCLTASRSLTVFSSRPDAVVITASSTA